MLKGEYVKTKAHMMGKIGIKIFMRSSILLNLSGWSYVIDTYWNHCWLCFGSSPCFAAQQLPKGISLMSHVSLLTEFSVTLSVVPFL